LPDFFQVFKDANGFVNSLIYIYSNIFIVLHSIDVIARFVSLSTVVVDL